MQSAPDQWTSYTEHMSERLIVQPPEIIDTPDNIIFLAGPIQGAPEWQTKAADLIHDIDPSVVVASPRKNYAPGEFVYPRQVDWETHFLRRAGGTGVVAFWLAEQERERRNIRQRFMMAFQLLFSPDKIKSPRAYGQTSRFELAEWKMKHEYEGAKLTIGIQEDFGNARYIRRRFSQDVPDVKIADSLEAMCENAVDLLHT